MDRTHETYTSWKKDLVKKMKEFDKLYTKHTKAIYPEISGIQAKAMLPLTLLIESNLAFHRLELQILAKEEIPVFRFKALEFEFSKFFTGVCEIFKEFG